MDSRFRPTREEESVRRSVRTNPLDESANSLLIIAFIEPIDNDEIGDRRIEICDVSPDEKFLELILQAVSGKQTRECHL
jgi:hypothetical protein